MTSLRSLLVASVGFGLLQVGCIGSADDVEAKSVLGPDSVLFDGPDGSGQPNGLSPRELDGSISDLLDATSYPIFGTAPEVSQGIINTGLFDHGGGVKSFRYAMRCALDANLAVEIPDEKPFEGGGVLNSTSGWTTGSLTLSQQEDLFACMIALVNPGGFSIPVLLNGSRVIDDGGAHNEFIYPEGVWTATVSQTGTVHFEVWPHPAFEDHCTGNNPLAMFLTRACAHGNSPTSCLNITVHDSADLETDCPPDSYGHRTCNGKPAIETWLSETGITELHPTCIAPQ